VLNLKQYNCAIFDCDGVILDSNGVKTEAFRETLKGENAELIARFISYHLSCGGISRYKKFQYFYQELKRSKDCASEEKKALVRYGRLSRSGLLSCEMIAGATDVLEQLKALGAICYVLSGGDEEELNYVFQHRNIAHYFRMILGSPNSKIQNMNRLREQGLLVYPGIYFGDSKSDCDVAMKNDFDFVFVSERSEWRDGHSICEQLDHKIIENFQAADR